MHTKTWPERKAARGTPTTAQRVLAGEQVGFIKPRKSWVITTKLRGGEIESSLTTTNKRDAHRRFTLIANHSIRPEGKYSGCDARMTCDGVLIKELRAGSGMVVATIITPNAQ